MIKLTPTQTKLAEQLLLSVKNHESVIEYNEIAARINPPIHWRQVGREIGEVSKLCEELGLPLISVKVISKGQGTAGSGFYGLMKELGRPIDGKSEKELFRAELKAVRECKRWYILADYLGLDIDLPRPEAHITESIHDDSSNLCTWIFPASSSVYDVISAFSELSELDWKQSVKCNIGDTVYIYCSKPYQKIIFLTTVIATNLRFEQTIDDKQFWVDQKEYGAAASRYGYARLKLKKTSLRDELSLNALQSHGLLNAPQGPMRVGAELLHYLSGEFMKAELKDGCIDEEIVPVGVGLEEGKIKQVVVNAYERNPSARKKCLAIHGFKCAVCGFDFASFYGNEFEGLIHVHHIRPLASIGKEYIVDPDKDLIPVCPNCHLALHSKPGGGVYSVEDLKQHIKAAQHCE